MVEERRQSQRVEAIVVVELDKEGRHGVTRDVSERGLLIATRFRFAVGDRLELTVHAAEASFKTNASVVRVDENPPNEEWRYRIGVHLEDALPTEVIEDGARAAAALLPPKGKSEHPRG